MTHIFTAARRSTEAQSNNCEGPRWGKKRRTSHAVTQSPKSAILRSAYSGFCCILPVVRRLFEVNSEPHTGARPSVRLCVGLITVESMITSAYEASDFGSSGLGQVLNDGRASVERKCREKHFPDKTTVRWPFGE
jgi:hypothetical protein